MADTTVELELSTFIDDTVTLTVALAADAVEDAATNGNLALAATGVTNAIIPNAAPDFSSPPVTHSVPENTAANTNIGPALPAATDADNDPLTYTLEDADAASFDFNATTRQLSTKSGVTYDHETKPSYSVTLKAEDDSGGSDTLAVTITITDVNEPPGRPAAPSVSSVAGNTTSLSVNWTAPSNTGPAIDNYDLRYREGTRGNFTNGPRNVSGTSETITGLTANTSYQVQVLARNAEGDSPWSPSSSGQTGALGAPDVPTGLSATRGNRQVMLGWVQPSGGAEVTDYEYEQDGSGTWISTGSTDTDYTVRNLNNGQTYTFKVRAANSAGASAPSTASASVIPATVPGAPTNIGVTGGNQEVELIWAAPASNGGESITGYEYEQSRSGTWISTGGTATTYTVRNLTNGQPYRFRVRALNSRRGGGGLRRLGKRHAGDGTGRTDEPQRHGQRPRGGSDLDGARVEPRGDDPALRIRAGLFRRLDLHRRHGHQLHGARPDQRPELRLPGAGPQPRRGGTGVGFGVGHADGHAGGAGHAVWPERHGRQPAGEAQLGPALRRRGAHAPRIRSGRFRDLDLHGRDSHQHHGDRPEQRSDLHV